MHSVSWPKAPQQQAPEFHVTIVIGAAVVLQTAFALIWAGSASERLAQLERRTQANAAMIERTTRLEEQMRFVAETLARVEAKLDRAAQEAE